MQLKKSKEGWESIWDRWFGRRKRKGENMKLYYTFKYKRNTIKETISEMSPEAISSKQKRGVSTDALRRKKVGV